MTPPNVARPAVLLLLAILVQPALAAKTDVLGLVNGDQVTGEVKSLDFGSLSYKTDSMGTVTVDWNDVVSLTSDQYLQVERTDGIRYFGHLVAADSENELRIKTAGDEVTVRIRDVIRMTPIDADESFFERLDGSFSLGVQAQKSSEVTTSSVSADISYRAQKYLWGLRLSSTVTDQPSEPTSARQSIDLNYQRFRPDRWFADWFIGWERNDELGLQARLSAGGAWGRYLVQTNRQLFSLTVGAQVAREMYLGSDPNDSVAEGRIEARYLFRNIAPDANLTFTSQVYPLLEDFSDYRAESDLSLRWEMFEDVFWDLTIGYSYDNSPPEGGAKSDSAVTTSIGYSF